MSSVTHPLPNWCAFTLPPRWSFCLAHMLTALSAPTGQQWKKKLAGIFLLLLPFPPLFCRQVQDYWVQKHQPQMPSIYSKMLGMKGETQTSQKFTQILCWEFFFFFPQWLWAQWQPGSTALQSVLYLWPGKGTRWHLTGKLLSRRQTPSVQLAGMRQTSNKMLSSATTPTKQSSSLFRCLKAKKTSSFLALQHMLSFPPSWSRKGVCWQIPTHGITLCCRCAWVCTAEGSRG